MPGDFTHADRVLRGRLGAHALHATHDSRELTAAARAASPGSLDYWLAQVPADLDDLERRRRAEHLKKAHFTRLALASARARRRKGGDGDAA